MTPGRAVELTLACTYSDRTIPLVDGSVRPDGIRLAVRWLRPLELFQRQLRTAEFDVSEMSLASYATLVASGDTRFTALPVFLSRVFRHSAIYVHAGAGIASPRDLVGRRVGFQDPRQTAAVWVRGILRDDHGVDLADLDVRTGAFDDLDAQLRAGEIDVLVSASPPPSYLAGAPAVRRLFADPRAVELEWYRRTRIFPIMHLVVVRRDLALREPRIVSSLHAAFEAAKRTSLERLHARTAQSAMVPWLDLHLEDDTRALGADPYAYGIAPNRHVLGTFLRYAGEQGLLARPLTVEELFHPATVGV